MLVFSADWHLSPIIWSSKPELWGDAYCSAEQVVDFCVKNAKKVDGLLLGGDIFDRNQPDSMSVMFFLKQMDKLVKARVPVFAIEGQHDLSIPPWTNVHPHVKHLRHGEPIEVSVDGHKHTLAGVNYFPAMALKEKVEQTSADILMLHQMHKDAIDIEGAWNFDPAWLPKGVKLVLMGDLHVTRSLGKCHYSGSTHLRAINEPRDKHFLIVKGLKKGLKVETKDIQTRDVLEFLVDSDEALQKAVAEVQAYKRHKLKPIVRPLVVAHIDPTVENARERLESGLAKADVQAHFMPFVARQTQEAVSVPTGSTGQITLQSCLSQLVDPEAEEELHSFVLSLIESADIEATLSEHKQRLGVA